MYQLTDSVLSIKGIGEHLQNALGDYQIEQLLDFLLFLPLRYEDRSLNKSIAQIKALAENGTIGPKDFVTCQATLSKYTQYRKGRLLISRATITDESGQLECIWFNNTFLKNSLLVGKAYFFSGSIKGQQLMQAKIEKVSEQTIHTGRLVPIYPKLGEIKSGKLRRLLAEAIGKLHQAGELEQLFKNLHFPSDPQDVIVARERLSLEEIVYLMQKSAAHKKNHAQKQASFQLPVNNKQKWQLPFELTQAQNKAIAEILKDLEKKSPMNRLLVGDVGSGKTVVAAIPASLLVEKGQDVCLLAPTKILAKQHLEKLSALFPHIPFQLVQATKSFKKQPQATFYVGTHTLLNKLEEIKPSLVIYDEQQRFGVKHRQLEEHLTQENKQAHLLSMTATPIPRSLMLSIFSHLDLSYLDQMPHDRQMAKTWLVPEQKEAQAIAWIAKELLDLNSPDSNTKEKRTKQAIIVCPFINPSAHGAVENVAAVEETHRALQVELKKIYKTLGITPAKQLQTAILHSKLNKKEQTSTIDAVYKREVQILVSTPMVEVGVDLPNADIILIKSAERFGLSSLHQLRGRVGRRGQASYCLLFSSKEQEKNEAVKQRLEKFCQEKDGLKLSQMDLEHRGAGDLLGYNQSGLSLHFASWTNVQIIENAKTFLGQNPDYQSFMTPYLDKIQKDSVENATN